MHFPRCHYIILAVIFSLLSISLFAQVDFNNYVNDDSAAIYSTSHKRPFRYGFAYSKEQVEKKFAQMLKFYDLRPGEVVGDIGAASGWMDGALSVLTDSVTYYVQDINTVFLNEDEFTQVIDHYSKVRARPQTNTFHFVIGTPTKTNLPDAVFDKIIFNNSFHEIKKIKKLIEDLDKKLKPGGKIIIHEEFSNDYRIHLQPGCKIAGFTVEEIGRMFEPYGYYLTSMPAPASSNTNYLTFEKNKSKALAFDEKIKTGNFIVERVDKLYKEVLSSKPGKTIEIGIFLKEHFNEYMQLYDTTLLEQNLNTLGYDYLNDTHVESAINVLKINAMLFPFSANVYDSLGEAYLKNDQYEPALLNYKKALELNPNNEGARKAVVNLQKRLDKKRQR